MVRDLIIYPDLKLFKKSKGVDKFNSSVRTLVNDMFETMYANKGIGLAAVQIGVPKKVIVIDLGDGKAFSKKVLINPKIIELSKKTIVMKEGCLSFPDIFLEIERPKKVILKAQDETGRTDIYECKDLMARVVLHEMEHLDGSTFIKN